MPYNFQSMGGNAVDALTAYLARQDAERRQAMLDELTKKNTESQITARTAQTTREDTSSGVENALKAAQTATATSGAQRATAEAVPAGTVLTPELKSAMGPLAGLSEKKGGHLPADVGEGPIVDEVFSGTTKQGQFDETQAMKAYIAQLTNDTKQQSLEIQRAVMEGRMNDAQARLALQQANLELHEKMANIDAAMKEQKLQAAQKTQADAAAGVKNSRANIRNLATGIMGDTNLGAVVGPLAGRAPTILPSSLDLDNRIKQLVQSLGLGEREKLKGSGAISDFETRMLLNSATNLDQRTNPDIFKRELQRIIDAYYGDMPRATVPGYDEQGNPIAGAASYKSSIR